MMTRWIPVVLAAMVVSAWSPAVMAQGVPGEAIPAFPAGLTGFMNPGAAQGGATASGELNFSRVAIQPQQPADSGWGPTCPCQGHQPAPFTPFMLGDFVGPVANLFSDVKIGEGESPRPTDRVFYRFNYHNNIEPNRWTEPTQPIHSVDLYRHTFGMEKTFFDERVSVGLRVPFYTLDADAKEFSAVTLPGGNLRAIQGGPGESTTHFGNLAAIAKGVLWKIDSRAASSRQAQRLASRRHRRRRSIRACPPLRMSSRSAALSSTAAICTSRDSVRSPSLSPASSRSSSSTTSASATTCFVIAAA